MMRIWGECHVRDAPRIEGAKRGGNGFCLILKIRHLVSSDTPIYPDPALTVVEYVDVVHSFAFILERGISAFVEFIMQINQCWRRGEDIQALFGGNQPAAFVPTLNDLVDSSHCILFTLAHPDYGVPWN